MRGGWCAGATGPRTCPATASEPAMDPEIDRAEALVRETLVWDDHAGFEVFPDAPIEPQIRPWREAGVDYLSVPVGLDPRGWERTVHNIAAWRRRLAREAPCARLVDTLADLDAARADGRMAIAFDIEGMNSLDGRVEMVGLYHRLGVRHMNFAYNLGNAAGAGCHDEDTGLTEFGRAVVDEMNRVGMVVDCTHAGHRTTMEAMERSAAPVAFTHSNPRALHDHGRNIDDDQIRACAATGGVVGITGINLFLGEAVPTPETVARHAVHVADLVGPSYVALALDYAIGLGTDDPPGDEAAYNDALALSPAYWPASEGYGAQIKCVPPSQLPRIVRELARLGFGEVELRGVLGGNMRRLAGAVWKAPV